MSESIITIKNLVHSYHLKKLFDNLSLQLPKHTFISIVGPNGSGKTTLLRHLIRSLPTEKDKIFLMDQDISFYTQKELARNLSYVPQQSKLEYDFTVYEVVAMGRYPYQKPLNLPSTEDHKIVNESLKAMKIEHLKDQNGTQLSGGEFQRMLIARALAQDSPLILLDEPVSHLDVHNQKEILNLLRNLVDSNKTTVITVLHDLNAVSAFSDLVVMMDQGKIVSEGKVNEVLTAQKIEEIYKVKVRVENNNERPTILPIWN